MKRAKVVITGKGARECGAITNGLAELAIMSA